MKKQPRSQNVQATPPPAPVIVQATPSPTPNIVRATPPPAPEPTPRLAPEGVFFLTQYVSLTTRSGVIGFEPGQRVKFVRGKETTLIVTDGKYEIEVTPDQLTNDLDLADLARRNDQTSQALLASRAAANLAAYQQDQKA
ncbi:MAG: hypothetical protein JO117_04260, partial [Verrucomicrobia bacterium]|nr:hypothetical protein [Verrucomicrobiota bacterium]